MKHIDEYRDRHLVGNLTRKIRSELTRPWTIMEICGGQTHAIMKYSLPDLLPGEITLIHGPGCPVCVTPVELIEKAIALARQENTILTSFGDMLRVPGSTSDLLSTKAQGGNVRMVYSPLDAVRMALEHPDRQVVFFAVGFETTAPAVALAVKQAGLKKLNNFSVLVAHVLVPPAMSALLAAPENRIDGFLAAGHVCTVMGYEEYIPLAERYKKPIVVTGFEPVDILLGILRTVQMLEQGRHGVENAYSRCVKKEGNLPARELLGEIFETCDRDWRGIGPIPGSGYRLRDQYRRFDAEHVFDLRGIIAEEPVQCIAGEILTGMKKPPECPAYGNPCNPEKPLGAPMVSSEGACAAYFKYGRKNHIENQSTPSV
ncbi:MAG: hydrogenase formation protein HypD [Bacteroidota bacterium]